METGTAKKGYYMIRNKAEDNTVAQSLSGIFGWPITIATDIAVIPLIYVPLWDQIRELYCRTNIGKDTASKIITGIVGEIFVDIALDKILGNVPLIGIYFNAICAKTMTWRLGTLFAMLAARGDEIDESTVKESMALIRKVFPQTDMFKFTTPDKATFIRLVEGVSDIPQEDYQRKVIKMLEHIDQY
ncbi:MAG: hypothetical protein U1B83_07485 [Candidatus Cloacimonadaceae bacterium]|nr:hypothetical protein [Candidatus Cloacimonadaceae bacterium]